MFGEQKVAVAEFNKVIEELKKDFEEKIKDKEISYNASIESLKDEFGVVKKQNDILKKTIWELHNKSKKKIQQLQEENKKLLNVSKELAESCAIISEDCEDVKGKQEDFESNVSTRRSEDLKMSNKNNRYLRDKILKIEKDFEEKFEGLLETIAEKLSETDENTLSEMLGSKITLRKLLTKFKDQNKAALYSIVYMLAKYFEDKGVRV